MNRSTLIALVATLAVAFVAPVSLQAREKKEDAAVPEANISQFGFGESINDVAFKKEDLEGKPAVIEYWGINCPPCVAFLPELAKIAKRYENKELKVVGVHAQNGTKEAINKLLDKAKVKYPVVENGACPINFSGIPRAFVFDKTGKLAWTGNPHDDGFLKAIREVTK
ncbi:MAG: TlpA disulfide reductase family protein [Verrucomicrobiales bacterium]